MRLLMEFPPHYGWASWEMQIKMMLWLNVKPEAEAIVQKWKNNKWYINYNEKGTLAHC